MNIVLQQLLHFSCLMSCCCGTNFCSHVFAIMGALGLDGDSSIMLEVEAITYNCYNVDIGTLAR